MESKTTTPTFTYPSSYEAWEDYSKDIKDCSPEVAFKAGFVCGRMGTNAPNSWEWKPIAATITRTDEGKWFYKITWQQESGSMGTVATSEEAAEAVNKALKSRTP